MLDLHYLNINKIKAPYERLNRESGVIPERSRRCNRESAGISIGEIWEGSADEERKSEELPWLLCSTSCDGQGKGLRSLMTILAHSFCRNGLLVFIFATFETRKDCQQNLWINLYILDFYVGRERKIFMTKWQKVSVICSLAGFMCLGDINTGCRTTCKF